MKSRNDVEEVIIPNPEEIKKVEAPKEEKKKEKIIKVGDMVKIKPTVSNDMLGRRIHNGIRNYNYTVKLVRVDGYLVLECLTYNFILLPTEVDLIENV